MKKKTIWIIVVIIVLILVIGYFTNWFGLGKPKTTITSTTTTSSNGGARLTCVSFDNEGNCTKFNV